MRVCTDCPQVQAVTRYEPNEPDELMLEESDVINVFRKLTDGKSQVFNTKLAGDMHHIWKSRSYPQAVYSYDVNNTS